MKIEEELKSIVLKSADLVEYATGSVVSRQIMKGETGTVTLFAFDKGQSLSEHTSPYNAFVQMMDGSAEFVVGDKHFAVNKDEMIILPAGVPHSVSGIDRFKMILTMIKEQ
ncbi:MAG: cupin domain-containing protein [Candidatus Kryptoniota bacterium]